MLSKLIWPIVTSLIIALSVSCAGNQTTVAASPTPLPVKSGYAEVNELKLYYELRGSGEPLILLHGGVGSTGMFEPIYPILAANRQVIAVDFQAHGRTADIDRPLTYEAMADDIAGLVKQLGLTKVDLMGYSLGGGVALQTAIRHPEIVRKLIVLSAGFKHDGWYPEILAAMAQLGPQSAEPMKQTPMYQVYSQVAPKVSDWPVLLTKLGNLMRTDYDWSKDVAKLTMPLLIMGGDADAVRTAHLVEFFGLLGGGKHDAGWDNAGRPLAQLAILPKASHYTIFASPAMAATAVSFLEGK